MITSKFNIGQQVRHKSLGYFGIIVDVDAKFSLEIKPRQEGLIIDGELQNTPWYHVIMEDEKGQPVHSYLAEEQLSNEIIWIQSEKDDLSQFAESVRCHFYLSNTTH